jgi:hypothetical protein
MTRTKRIYNRRLKKAQRNDLSLPTYVNGIYINKVGFPLTWRSYICMGNCCKHKDHTKDQILLRKRKKEQFRFDLKNEYKCQEDEEEYDNIEREYKASLEKIGIDAARNLYEMFKIYAKS